MKAKLAKVWLAMALGMTATTVQAQGLSRARSSLMSFQSEFRLIIPIVGGLSLAVLAILWAIDVLRFDRLIRWGAGVILAGSAVEIVSMLVS